MYGYAADMTNSFGTNLTWEYDATLSNKLLYTKFYQTTTEDYIPETKNCSGNCMYCGTNNYCTSCNTGMFSLFGVCKGSIAMSNVQKDPIEREYKSYAQISYFCLDPMCIECTDSNYQLCREPDPAKSFCIRNASYYNSTCYTECPKGTYLSQSATLNCSICPDNCTACSASNNCTECRYGYLVNSSHYCVTTNCGDGLITSPEICDDGNTNVGDGCSDVCLVESGFSCNTMASGMSLCIPICGDGRFFGVGGEQCDDGNTSPGDGCDANCKIESGWWCIEGSTTSPNKCYCSPLHVNYQDTFTNNYMTMTFKFSKNLVSKVAYSSPSAFCQVLFSANTYSSFGSNSTCQLIGDTLVINLDNGNTIIGGDILEINPGVLGGQSCNQTYDANLIAPNIPAQQITGTIIAPKLIPYCLSTQFDIVNISGSLGRPYKSFTINADVSGSGTDQVKINNELKLDWLLSLYKKINNSTYSVQIPEYSFLADSQYSIKLDIINFQNIEYITSVSLSTSSGIILNIQLEGVDNNGILTIATNEEVNIRTVLTISQCSDPFPNISALITKYKQISTADLINITQLTSNTSSSRLLKIKANTLKQGYTYDFRVDVNNTLQNQIIGSKTFSIRVKQPDLKAIISPISQSIPVDQPLMISGSNSYDSN